MGHFTGARGTSLFRQRWRPEAPARGVLVNLHGLGDHSALYPAVVERFTSSGFAVHSPDLRGNGRSPGQRGYISRWGVFREDLRRFLAVVGAEEPGLPVFLLGNSLGGLIVLEYALEYPEGLQGVIAASPPLGSLGIPAPLLALGSVMSRVLPRFALRTGMDLSGLARDPAVVETVAGGSPLPSLGHREALRRSGRSGGAGARGRAAFSASRPSASRQCRPHGAPRWHPGVHAAARSG